MIVYLDMRTGREEYGNATDHRGQPIGTWQQTSTWQQGLYLHPMHAIQLATRDGAEWTGRGAIRHPYAVIVQRKTGA